MKERELCFKFVPGLHLSLQGAWSIHLGVSLFREESGGSGLAVASLSGLGDELTTNRH